MYIFLSVITNSFKRLTLRFVHILYFRSFSCFLYCWMKHGLSGRMLSVLEMFQDDTLYKLTYLLTYFHARCWTRSGNRRLSELWETTWNYTQLLATRQATPAIVIRYSEPRSKTLRSTLATYYAEMCDTRVDENSVTRQGQTGSPSTAGLHKLVQQCWAAATICLNKLYDDDDDVDHDHSLQPFESRRIIEFMFTESRRKLISWIMETLR